MTKEPITTAVIRRLRKDESVPYELLLLADPSRNLIDSYLESSEIYVAQFENKIIGTYVLYPLTPDTVEIKNISVDDEYQGRGLGKLMLRAAEDNAKQKGFKTMIIGTGNSSVGQLYLYQREGFEISGIKKNFFVDHYPEPLFENGIQVKHMLILTKNLLSI